MSDNKYKTTLNLPDTKFPMRANLPQREPGMLDSWYKEDLYGAIRAARRGRKSFILHDGPPYANGNIHLGHSVNKILKDIILKAKTLSGYDAPYIPGWDCHGLPIELKVEKKVGKPGRKVTAAQFREECRKYAKAQVEAQKADFKRLGVIGDWDHPYLTMNFDTEANTAASSRSTGAATAAPRLQRLRSSTRTSTPLPSTCASAPSMRRLCSRSSI